MSFRKHACEARAWMILSRPLQIQIKGVRPDKYAVCRLAHPAPVSSACWGMEPFDGPVWLYICDGDCQSFIS